MNSSFIIHHSSFRISGLGGQPAHLIGVLGEWLERPLKLNGRDASDLCSCCNGEKETFWFLIYDFVNTNIILSAFLENQRFLKL
jgi:hypothetical protein